MAPKVKRPRKSRDSKDQTKVLSSDTLEELSSVKSLVLPKTIVEKMVRTAEVEEIKLKDKSGSIIDISTLNEKECIVKITGDNDTQTDETRQFVEDVNNNHIDDFSEKLKIDDSERVEFDWDILNNDLKNYNSELKEDLFSWKESIVK